MTSLRKAMKKRARRMAKAREDEALHPSQRRAFRREKFKMGGIDALEGQLTPVPGVSDRGIESRRGAANVPADKVVSHGYSRVYSDPSKHMQRAKEYFRSVLEHIRSQPHPNLPKAELEKTGVDSLDQTKTVVSGGNPVASMPGWNVRHDQASGMVHFNHGVHGTISIKKNPNVQHAGEFPYVAMHGGSSVGRYKSPQEAIAGVKNYTSTLRGMTQPYTRQLNTASTALSPPGDPTKSFMRKSEQYFRSLLKDDKSSVGPHPDQAYNPKTERPNQRARTKAFAEQMSKNPDEKHALKFSTTNSKLAKDGVVSFNLPPVETCPGAGSCAKYCYADTGSFLRFYKTTMPPRVANWLASKREDFVPRMIDLIGKYKAGRDENGKPVKMNAIRIHDSGDFYSPKYIDQWKEIAKAHPDVKMYAYTKSHHPALASKLDELNALPNVNIVQSLGSKYDHLVNPDKPHAVIFPDKATMDRAGYADAMATDLTAADKANKKVGLYIHGQSGGQYKGLEDHLKDNPELLRRVLEALKER